ENDPGIFPPEVSESRLQPQAKRDQAAWNLADPVNVNALGEGLGLNSGHGCGLDEEVLDHFRHESPFTGLDRLSHNRREVQLSLGQSLQGRFGDRAEALGIDVTNDPGLDVRDVGLADVEVAEELFQQVAREDLADHIEDLVGSQLIADLAEPLKQLGQDTPLVGVHGDEIEDEAVVLLAVAMNASHALFQPHGAPGDIEVDHEPAELQVNPFSGGLGRGQHLGLLLEITLGMDPRAGRVPVTDLHAAVYLRDREPPLAKLAQRTVVLAVAHQVVERVLVLGKDQQLHAPIFEDPVLGQDAAELGDLGTVFCLEMLGLGNQGGQPGDFFAEHDGVNRDDLFLQSFEQLALLVLGQLVEVIGYAAFDTLAAISFGI